MNENNDMIQTTEEAVENINKKLSANDWWGKHNMTTRSITITSALLLVIVVICNIIGVKIEHFDTLISTLSDMTLYITLAIILGVNGAVKLLETIKAYKE